MTANEVRGKRAEAIIVVDVFICAVFLCSYRLEVYPAPWFDEGLNFQAAKNVALYGQYGLRSTEGFVGFHPATQTGPTVLLPIALIFRLVGTGVLQARLVVVVLYTVLALAVFYWLVRNVCGKRVALLALLLLIFTFDHEFTLVVFTAVWFGWYAFFPIGWMRYAFVPAATSTVFTARLLGDLWDWAGQRRHVFSRRLSLVPGQVAIVGVIVMLLLSGLIPMVEQIVQAPDSGLQELAQYLLARTSPGLSRDGQWQERKVLPIQIPAVVQHQRFEHRQTISCCFTPMHTFMFLPSRYDQVVGFLGMPAADVDPVGTLFLVVDDVHGVWFERSIATGHRIWSQSPVPA